MNILSGRDFSPAMIEDVLADARYVREKLGSSHRTWLAGKRIAILMYEASLRTRFSFGLAVSQAGGEVLGGDGTLKDDQPEHLGRLFAEAYDCDAIVIRHPIAKFVERLAEYSPIPVVSAGHGAEAHPTQGLLDLATIRQYKDLTKKTVIVIAGDLRYGRAARCLIRTIIASLHGRSPGTPCPVELVLASPPEFGLLPDVMSEIEAVGIECALTHDFAEAVAMADILYMTRVQKERFKGIEADPMFQVMVKALSLEVPMPVLDAQMLVHLKPDAIVMHPMPAEQELPLVAFNDKHCKIIEQAANAVPVRMALLRRLLI